MELALIEIISATTEQEGATTVSAHMLFDIVRKLPEGPIDFNLNAESQQLLITAGRAKFKLSYLPAEDFPHLTADTLPFSFKISAPTFKNLLDRSRFAMSSEETRYYLNGIYFHPYLKKDTKVLRCVATDSHRLACVEAPLPEGAQEMPGVILSRKTVSEIRKLIDDFNEEIGISLSEKRIEFSLPHATLSSRLIDGVYPDYEQAIPQNNDKTLVVEAKAFSLAVDRVATVASDKLRIIKINAQENNLILSAASQELGSATEEMAVDFSYTTPIEIGFNARYLLDIAQQINEEETKISLSDSNSPAIIQGFNNTEALYVLMPMRF